MRSSKTLCTTLSWMSWREGALRLFVLGVSNPHTCTRTCGSQTWVVASLELLKQLLLYILQDDVFLLCVQRRSKGSPSTGSGGVCGLSPLWFLRHNQVRLELCVTTTRESLMGMKLQGSFVCSYRRTGPRDYPHNGVDLGAESRHRSCGARYFCGLSCVCRT